MFYVYILVSNKDGMKYIGSTNNLKKRFEMHNLGKVYSTKNRVPFEIVYYEAYKAEKDARMRERNLKLRSKAYIQLRRRFVNSLELVRG